ncbi:HAD family hydrolase [Nesterenkonia muleiensis]|uniref:HAD family hydrolase n=1 Tax=Nesterenkonia muleiensis TaxID=2282648 RepID=UPI000E73AA79|nr:HAD family phosphatase [Nesterenkonia muleiensis]
MPEIRAALFDFDGVIRRFDPEFISGVEHRYGLAAGTINAAAFAQPLITELTTGTIPRREWIRRVGEQIGSPEAAEAWGNQPTYADQDLLAVVDELRAEGLTTAVLTNGTDEVRAEAAELGVLQHFDAFFNSAEIGFIKPDPRAFQHVLDELSLTAAEVLFTDDSQKKLPGAVELGMTVHHYTSVANLRKVLRSAL